MFISSVSHQKLRTKTGDTVCLGLSDHSPLHMYSDGLHRKSTLKLGKTAITIRNIYTVSTNPPTMQFQKDYNVMHRK